MRRRHLLFSVLLAAGCSGTDSISRPRPADTGESATRATSGRGVAAGASCARAPLGDWVGAAVMRDHGMTGGSATRADVRWVLASTEGCVDRYRPRGTVTFDIDEACGSTVSPSTFVILPGDGLLTIDRTREPVAYELRGATTWDAAITCPGEDHEPLYPVGGPWALAAGTFDGDRLSGVVDHGDGAAARWTFHRADAPSYATAFTTPRPVAAASPAP